MSADRPTLLIQPSPRQLVLALADGWDDSAAVVQCFIADSGSQSWQPVAGPVPAMLGRAGMAVGGAWSGLNVGLGPAKQEGDGRSPAGVFPITALFGSGPVADAVGHTAKLPYWRAMADLKCVDDPASRYYNRIVDQSAVTPDWHSCEDMLRQDGRYEIGAVLGCNCDPVVPGVGSCLFLHVWAAPGVPTAGCTALARENMLAMAGWLDGALSPVLVQLPRAIYAVVRQGWGLPAIGG